MFQCFYIIPIKISVWSLQRTEKYRNRQRTRSVRVVITQTNNTTNSMQQLSATFTNINKQFVTDYNTLLVFANANYANANYIILCVY